jgi:hypothetical protein
MLEMVFETAISMESMVSVSQDHLSYGTSKLKSASDESTARFSS